MRNPVLRLYLTVRKPRNFLRLLCLFITTSLILHVFRGYDADWGSTNLILSIEATIAGAVMLMVQEEAAEMQEKMLKALVSMAEAQHAMLADYGALLLAIKDADERLLNVLTAKEKNDDLA
jgi:hypothetical protein